MHTSITPEQLRELIDFFISWAEAQEALILAEGEPLGSSQIGDARLIGVRRPEKVRLLEVAGMPSPEHPHFSLVVEKDRLIPPETEAVTLGYGIYIRSDHCGDRGLVAHELMHVAQGESLGGLRPFFTKYLEECFRHGYPNGPMEQEAIGVERAFSPEEAEDVKQPRRVHD